MIHPLEIPGNVTMAEGKGGLPMISVTSAASTAEIYLHGAHVTRFRKNGEAPLLFLSDASSFTRGKAIRGGIPVIFPWFGPREGLPAHGFARTVEWDLMASAVLADGSVRLDFRMPAIEFFEVEYIVTVGEVLTLELVVGNTGDLDASFENCLHTYFQVGAIGKIAVSGLAGCTYQDKVNGGTATETAPSIRFTSEVDRVYSDTAAAVEILDPSLNRRIRVAKSGSHSTVVWNPWIEKSKAMADFGDEEYLQMVCVESGNVGTGKVILPPGERATLKVGLSSVTTA